MFLGFREMKSSAFRHAEFKTVVEHQSRNVQQAVKMWTMAVETQTWGLSGE